MRAKTDKSSSGKVLDIYLSQKGTKCTLFAQQHFNFRNVFIKETECHACKNCKKLHLLQEDTNIKFFKWCSDAV